MDKLTVTDLVQRHCLLTKQWAVVLYPGGDDLDEIEKAAPFIDTRGIEWDDTQAVVDGLMIVLCDSEAEHDRVFDSIVGPDGPTLLNPYDGPCKIYAWTCGPDGEILTENT
jgi:hypothetical protein